MSKKKFITNWFITAWGKVEVDKKVSSGIFSTKTVTVAEPNPRFPDCESFAQSIEDIYTNFDGEGYDVINIIPLVVGADEAVNAELKQTGASTYLGQVGFSTTRGAVVVGKLRDPK